MGGCLWLSDHWVSPNAPRNKSASSTGDTGAATTSGGTARTAHSPHNATQAVVSAATAGGSSSASIQFERFKVGPVLGDEVDGDFIGQVDARRALRGAHHDQPDWVPGGAKV